VCGGGGLGNVETLFGICMGLESGANPVTAEVFKFGKYKGHRILINTSISVFQ
jgi:hypothetical protein